MKKDKSINGMLIQMLSLDFINKIHKSIKDMLFLKEDNYLESNIKFNHNIAQLNKLPQIHNHIKKLIFNFI
jgi:hypothetical protein